MPGAVAGKHFSVEPDNYTSFRFHTILSSAGENMASLWKTVLDEPSLLFYMQDTTSILEI